MPCLGAFGRVDAVSEAPQPNAHVAKAQEHPPQGRCFGRQPVQAVDHHHILLCGAERGEHLGELGALVTGTAVFICPYPDRLHSGGGERGALHVVRGAVQRDVRVADQHGGRCRMVCNRPMLRHWVS